MNLIEVDNSIFYANDITSDLPLETKINGNTYYRFCDFIYIPTFTENLTPEQVKTVSEIREKYFLIHDQFKINFAIRECFKNLVNLIRPNILLEVGPGKNPLFNGSVDFIEKYYLVDFREDIVSYLKNYNFNSCLFNESITLDIETGLVNCIIAIFVFQFNIPENQIKELFRILNSEGVVIANVYRRSIKTKKMLIDNFKKHGFTCEIVIDNIHLCKEHEYWLLSKNRNSIVLNEVKNHLNKLVSAK